MDLDPLQNITVARGLDDAQARLGAASMVEVLTLVAIPMLSVLISVYLHRYAARRTRPGTASWLDLGAALGGPLVALGLCALSALFLRHAGIPVELLPFGVKLAIAWFAVGLVALMSTRRVAGWFIALVIVPITLVHLFGLWDPVTDALEQVKFHLGTTELNLYLVLKGIVAIVVLQWVAGFTLGRADQRLRRLKDMRASNRTLIMKILSIALYCMIFIFGMQLLGINLTALSVLGGALGVGLGFGLQKIASNFISGIILLFEKSIEMGDLIELTDGTMGTVRQTYARYTLLETQQGKEILIPNEEFITQRVITWTHSTRQARVEIPVSVAYDTDLRLAMRLMLDAAKAHPQSFRDKEPLAFVINFGGSGIDLQLYFWVADVTEGRMGPKSDVMLAINDAFKQHGISIPFPQQEVRVINATAPMTVKKRPAAKKKKS